ncbi:peptide chain release factor 1 [Segniliparus rugosus]|uniref:Peptide chain release factor 1 n=1 Tax=Segniliparus rugosus (strain ATCC BAA-974 / DSM 45345 / CCUG 50838 / CIP 108380 / JCM 13579 / CDC 945) TaxID=679197 RepID=E5XLI7_SEGRC|nr:peptide chain release factor 1 [Segniliparus rugosus]EFV14760.1 peptide chain release factor 1 [Segniliparus rugosus ATCC BAA-974]
MTNSLDELIAEYESLQERWADPSLQEDVAAAKKVGKRVAELAPIYEAHAQREAAQADLAAAHELAELDPEFAKEEVERLTGRISELDEELDELLAPRDPHDGEDVVLEVKAGAGGEESALFAGDLIRMYTKFAERRRWRVEVLSIAESDLGGVKDATISIKRTGGDQSPAQGVWAWLKHEGGVHRVQRVPATESQGRIHTSAAGVLAYPEPEDAPEVVIDESELRIDVYRSSGKGGQGVNTTDSAVRITHLPTGLVVTCQNERSQLQNKARAMVVLAARLEQLREEKAAADAASGRKEQIRTVDRSERIRTYNFPENRIADHRIGYKASNLDMVLEGDLEPMLSELRLKLKASE